MARIAHGKKDTAMRISKEKDRIVAGILTVSAACLLASPLLAQDELTGVSHPDAAIITADPADNSTHPAKAPAPKPSAAIPAASSDIVYGPYVPYHAPGTSAAAASAASVPDPDGSIVTAATAGGADRRLLSEANAPNLKNNPDAGIVTSVPSIPGEMRDGTLIKATLDQELSTLTTTVGTKFTARVDEPVMKNGKVIVPVGSTVEGRVTWVRGGKRIGGAAGIHLEPRTVVLPDGSEYVLDARVIDTGNWNHTRVDEEGTILHRDFGKGTLGAMSLATGGTMAAGAVIGGLPGALIGAGVGAGASTVVWLKQDRQANLPKDLEITFSLTEPMSTTPMAASVTSREPRHSGGE